MTIENYINETETITEQELPIREEAKINYTYYDFNERVDELINQIERQLRESLDPQFILLSAVELIGVLINDTEWSKEQSSAIVDTYGEPKQESLLIDNNAILLGQVRAKQQEYEKKLLRQACTYYSHYKKLMEALENIIKGVNDNV